MNATTDIPAEWAALAAEINAKTEAARAAIAATNYRRTVTLRRDADEIHITIAPADNGITWEIQGVGITYGHGGRNHVGDVASKYRTDLDDAKTYANGWVKSLTTKGYRIIR